MPLLGSCMDSPDIVRVGKNTRVRRIDHDQTISLSVESRVARGAHHTIRRRPHAVAILLSYSHSGGAPSV
ncbi:MAG: hypothetical protein E6Q61_01735 [Nitrosomonas sp.]|nr:MAG: hypothetical protein E6Q61_01735 [Nitrosomonas sp.]